MNQNVINICFVRKWHIYLSGTEIWQLKNFWTTFQNCFIIRRNKMQTLKLVLRWNRLGFFGCFFYNLRFVILLFGVCDLRFSICDELRFWRLSIFLRTDDAARLAVHRRVQRDRHQVQALLLGRHRLPIYGHGRNLSLLQHLGRFFLTSVTHTWLVNLLLV